MAIEGGETVNEDWFWQIVEEARQRADDDPDAMAEFLERRFAVAGDDTLRAL
jgi:hypothetical protein